MTDRDWKGDGNSIWKTLGASNHTDKEREQDDYYATDPVAIDKLLTVERPHRQIWECACGAGHLSERLEKAGYSVLSTDIRDRGYGKFGGEVDFLRVHSDYAPFAGHFDILTNPPYKYAKEFVIKSLDLLPPGCRCYMFLKLTFLEGKARYAELFKSTPPPLRVRIFRARPLREERRVRQDARGRRVGGRLRVVRMGEGVRRQDRGRVDIGGRYEQRKTCDF